MFFIWHSRATERGQFGITPLRIDGRTIANDIATAAERIEAALACSDAH